MVDDAPWRAPGRERAFREGGPAPDSPRTHVVRALRASCVVRRRGAARVRGARSIAGTRSDGLWADAVCTTVRGGRLVPWAAGRRDLRRGVRRREAPVRALRTRPHRPLVRARPWEAAN